MALSENNNNGLVMPVQPMGGYGYGGNGGGFGFGGDWAWILLLLVLGGGWGGFGGFGMGGFGGAMMGADMFGGFGLYPWLNNSEHISNGFRDAQLSDSVTSVRDGISSLSTQLCNCCGDMQLGMANGFAGVQQSLCNGFNGVNNSVFGAQTAISQQLNANQLADLERSFAAQTATTAAINGVNSSLQNCCCENRAGIADLKYTVATENCADRYEAAQNTQGIISAITAGIQSIKDDLCADRLDAERRENQNLRTQLSMAQLAAATTAQTADIKASQQTANGILLNELRSCPIPSQPVFGNSPIFTCAQNVAGNNCGCSCGGFAN